MKTPSIFQDSKARAQELRDRLRTIAKKALTFSFPDEEFRVDFESRELAASLESHLWNPTRSDELPLLDGSLLKVATDGGLEWIDATRSERHRFREFSSTLTLPHAWASVRISRSHSSKAPIGELFDSIPRPEQQENLSSKISKNAAITAAALIGVFSGIQHFWSEHGLHESGNQPIPEAYVKLLTTPVQSPRAGIQGNARSQESRQVKAVQQALHQAVKSQALQKTLARFLSAPTPVLPARNPAGALPLSGTLVKSGEFNQKLAALTRMTQVGPSSVGGNLAGGRLGTGGQAVVSGQGKAFVSLRLEDAKVEEGLTKDEVGEVIHRHAAEIRYCYEAAMLRRPDLEGKLAIAFTINGQGTVLTSRFLQSSM